MSAFTHSPIFDYYYKACRKGDATTKAITVGESAVRVLADASEITGSPRDNFEMREITKESLKSFGISPFSGCFRFTCFLKGLRGFLFSR
jgi:hypothetical protein